MLLIKRKSGRKIFIDAGRISIEVIEVRGDSVKLGFCAPDSVTILREELLPSGPSRCCRCGGDLPRGGTGGLHAVVSPDCRGQVDGASGRCGAFAESPLWDTLPDVSERKDGAA